MLSDTTHKGLSTPPTTPFQKNEMSLPFNWQKEHQLCEHPSFTFPLGYMFMLNTAYNQIIDQHYMYMAFPTCTMYSQSLRKIVWGGGLYWCLQMSDSNK